MKLPCSRSKILFLCFSTLSRKPRNLWWRRTGATSRKLMLSVSFVSQPREQGRRWPGCCRDVVWSPCTCVKKPKQAKPEALARFWRWWLRQGEGTLRTASFCCCKVLQAGTGLSPANKVLGKEGCSEFCLSFEMLSLPMHKEVWVKRTCQSWNYLTEILLQKDMLQGGCLGVTAAVALRE